MNTKICFKCSIEQPLDNFYVHRQMSDGHLNKCKSCTKKDVKIGKIPRTCSECNKKFMALSSEINRGGGKTCSRKCYYDRLRFYVKRGEDSPNWKGDDVGMGGLHDWVRKTLGTPSICEHCGTTKGKFDWSNKSQMYKRDVSDWQRLCRSCHIKYDNMVSKRKVTMIKRYGTLSVINHDEQGRFKKMEVQ